MKPVSFYENINKEAVAFADALLAKYPEIKSAAVVIEWNLPENIQGELPVGFLRTPDKKISVGRAFDALRTATKYGKQLCGMIDYIGAAEQKAIADRAQAAAKPAVEPATSIEEKGKEESPANADPNI